MFNSSSRSPPSTVSKRLQIGPNFSDSPFFQTFNETQKHPRGWNTFLKAWKSVIKENVLCLEIFCIGYATCLTNLDVSSFELCDLENVFMGATRDNWGVPQLVLLNSNFYKFVRKYEKKSTRAPTAINISCHAIKHKQFAGVLGTFLGNSWHFCITCQTRAGVERDQNETESKLLAVG